MLSLSPFANVAAAFVTLIAVPIALVVLTLFIALAVSIVTIPKLIVA